MSPIYIQCEQFIATPRHINWTRQAILL